MKLVNERVGPAKKTDLAGGQKLATPMLSDN